MGKAAAILITGILLVGCGSSDAIIVPATVEVTYPVIHDTLYTTEAYDEALWTIDSLVMEVEALRVRQPDTVRVAEKPQNLRYFYSGKITDRGDTLQVGFHLVRPRPWFDIKVRYKPFSYEYDEILDDFVRQARPDEKPSATTRWLILGLSGLSLVLIVLLFFSLRRSNG